MSSTQPHVEIRPKPANGRNSSGAVSQIVAPRRRAGPLVFVNTSDLNTENERQGNRKMVKKWAMLNRNARYMRPPSASAQKAQFLSWDSRTDREVSTTPTSASDDSTPATAAVSSSPPDPIFAAAAQQQPATASSSSSSQQQLSPSLSRELDNLCVELDPHAKTLLEQFLNGGQNDVMLPTGRVVSANRGVFPMLVKSPAALCSMVATLESNPSNLTTSDRKEFRDYYLSLALTHTTSLIQNMDKEPTPVVFFCVSLLMWIAKHTGDESALMWHFNGMIVLMIRHWDLFSLTPYLRHGPFFWTAPSNEGLMIPGIAEPSAQSRPTDDQIFSIDLSDFADLQSHGWVSGDLVSFLPHILAMRSLVTRVKNNQLALEGGRDLFSYICYIARTLSTLEASAISQFEHVIRMVAIMHYYSSIFQNSAQAVGWLTSPIQAHLQQMNLAELMTSYPRIIFWIALSAGHFSIGPTRSWWIDLLSSTSSLVELYDFESSANMCENRLLWTREMDAQASDFWNVAVQVSSSRRGSGESIQ